MNKHNKWKIKRAGLLNFWYYDDEIFDFADGKLLLRGSNGSGKSVTMQSILPILLDGKKSPDRLDPFGSRARKIEDYLLGEKEIAGRDERTGYLFLEYKRENTNQYITTGIGLQARRHKTLNFWGFVITDNRRIGEDFFLYEYEHHAGEKQQIPLSRIQLENRIGTGGHVVRTQGDYMKLVNKYIFGFETIEAYEDLIKLLIQLRSPKLSKDFRPTVIYEILEAALPPLTDEDLRHLSDTIEHMDQTKQQIEQLDREQEALDKLIKRYHAYNEYKLVEAASHYVEAKKRFQKEEKLITEKTQEKHELEFELEQLTKRKQELEQQSELLEKKQNRLQKHKVWSLEEERTTEIERFTETNREYEKKDKAVTEKTKQEVKTKEQIEHLSGKISEIENKMADQLIDLAADAAESSFERHELNVQDFERSKDDNFDFTVWKQEAGNHYDQLGAISEQLRTYEQKKTEIAETEKIIANTQLEIDQTKQEENDWTQVFEKDKQEKIDEIHAWAEKHDFLGIDSGLLQQTSRDLLRLYEPTSFEIIRMPYVQASNDFQLRVNESIAMKKAERTAIQQEIAEQESELAEWKSKRDPEPPNQQEATKEARKRLQRANHAFIPFYEAVEFQEHVDEEVRKRIEAALIDAGLLDALITNENILIEHDRVFQPNPQMMAHTLADYLFPDVDEHTKVEASRIDEVLRSILVESDEAEGITIRVDGTYKIGSVEGHAVPVETVRFIGKNARKRYREEQIERITAEIERLNKNEQHVQKAILALEEKVEAAQAAMKIFPNDDDLNVSFNHIETCRFQISQLKKQLVNYDQKLREIIDVFQAIKRKLDMETKGLNIEFTYEAYQEALTIQRRYEKDVSDLEKYHVTYRHEQRNKEQAESRLNELELEVDELKGELNLLEDKQIRLEQNIAEIESQLQAHGMEDIRKQIQDVQRDIAETNAELETNRDDTPLKAVKLQTIETVILEQQQRVRFSKVIIEAWKKLYVQEIAYGFIELPEEIEAEKQVTWIIKKYKDQLTEPAKIEEQLSKVFYEQLSNLMEYRMTEHSTPIPDVNVSSELWTDEQNILLENWKNKASRRIIQLDFQGKRLSPYYVQEMVEEDRSRQQTMLNDQDRQLYEEILFDSVGKKLRSRIHRAQEWTKKMNELMIKSDSTSGISFSIQWKPRTAETEAELDTKELVDLLRRDPRLLKEADLNQVMEHFRSKIDRAKELIEIKGEGNTLLQVLKEVLDYRYWFSFVLSYQRVGEPKRELTNNAFYKFSGGEKAMAMYIPLFTACYSRYLEADQAAPYIISLDEAFAGVDDDNISAMFRIVEELGFDYIMNSQVLWGDYDTVSSLSICELVRPKNANFVTVIRYLWDGKSRQLVVDEDEALEESLN
ncbi:TIGR02680 family protein [Pseudogracilibacillus sp. SO30301A]|uniref:TIGR02680 family protein n=1 Tax=Pseudogracilibacillus sp. SO30301A TaxID=3098291 RepID=UPI00300E6C07